MYLFSFCIKYVCQDFQWFKNPTEFFEILNINTFQWSEINPPSTSPPNLAFLQFDHLFLLDLVCCDTGNGQYCLRWWMEEKKWWHMVVGCLIQPSRNKLYYIKAITVYVLCTEHTEWYFKVFSDFLFKGLVKMY